MTSYEANDHSSELSPRSKENKDRVTNGRMPSSIYELFVLGELMVHPMHGYRLHEIVDKILGPFHRLSWGTLYPLIRRIEGERLVSSEIVQRDTSLFKIERGQPRKIYHLTMAGRERFFVLMLDRGEYNRDYPDLFAIKLTKFGYLTADQQLTVLRQYQEYLHKLRTYYQSGADKIPEIAGIVEDEQVYIFQLIEYRLHTLYAEIAWLESKIARLVVDIESGKTAPSMSQNTIVDH